MKSSNQLQVMQQINLSQQWLALVRTDLDLAMIKIGQLFQGLAKETCHLQNHLFGCLNELIIF